jgi:tRNA uridine 5-carboxymethylaminomethyl modification enzyme
MSEHDYQCIVIGAGHAGVEAAHAAARLGAKTALITLQHNTIAQMSCNPSIGGLAKGQIVCEVDALGGLMARAIDATGIQFRMLNQSKGPAVQSPRAQADKDAYAAWIRHALEETPQLDIIESMAQEIVTNKNAVTAVNCDNGVSYAAPTVIIAAGTFLRGIMHIGKEQFPGGRRDEPASDRLSDCLRHLGLTVRRLKTGTPPRLDARTVDFDKLQIQHGDPDPKPFSFVTDAIVQEQVPCWITYTNPAIHQLLRDNLDRAPLYTGQISSIGPRYCPSIEGKIVRFADKQKHQVYLEPEDATVTTIYCNGISTSVPRDVQHRMLELMPGTEKAVILHYAYAIEYDYCPSIQLKRNLESKHISGLFLAGQINGTSGYEEAAGQGILAGINAVRKLNGQAPFILNRSDAYLGVLMDDLLTKKIDEPYRMFTSRAEYRLSLRADNADQRLTPLGRSVGLVDDERWNRFQKKLQHIEHLKTYLQKTRSEGTTLWNQLRRPHNRVMEDLKDDPFMHKNSFKREVIEAVSIDAKYEGYLGKQQRLVAGLQSLDHIKLPPAIDYQAIDHLRAEAREKLSSFTPETLGQASRIGGITPADITVILVYLKKYDQKSDLRKPC